MDRIHPTLFFTPVNLAELYFTYARSVFKSRTPLKKICIFPLKKYKFKITKTEKDEYVNKLT